MKHSRGKEFIFLGLIVAFIAWTFFVIDIGVDNGVYAQKREFNHELSVTMGQLEQTVLKQAQRIEDATMRIHSEYWSLGDKSEFFEDREIAWDILQRALWRANGYSSTDKEIKKREVMK